MLQAVLYLAVVVHAAFMLAELFPFPTPVLLKAVSEKWFPGQPLLGKQHDLVANIVRNAGVYNGIVAGGLLWAALSGNLTGDLARVMLAGALVAGLFGAVTLKTWIPLVQAALGIAGLILICKAV